jgi:diamine N-acetyltransferase
MSGSMPFHRSSASIGTGRLTSLDPHSAGRIAAFLASVDPWKRLGYGQSGLHAYLTRPDPGLSRYSITQEQECAGVVCVRCPWLRGPFLELIAVLDGFQGKGLGGSVIGWMEKEARGVCTNLWTSVSSFNHLATAFYRRHGFEEATLLKDFLKPGEDELLLRKRVPGSPPLAPPMKP